MNNIQLFCQMIRNRSKENKVAMQQISGIMSPAISILRQELDSLVRVIYLLHQTKIEQNRLVDLTISGKKWNMKTIKGKLKLITDKDMVNLANTLQGWTEYVYKFGCSFIHLSDYHNYIIKDPFKSLTKIDKDNILRYMRQYHGGPLGNNIGLKDIAFFIPGIFDKISSNLECYIKELEK